jgi:hypothetical protein
MQLQTEKNKDTLASLPLSERVPTLAAIMAAVEILLGSILHGLRIPFGGNFLSLVQSCFLTVAARAGRSRMQSVKMPFYVSSISSCLKSLSPAGNKLGPMLSIWMQGALFSSGVAVFGKNPVGTAIGGALLSLWAFVQPVLTLYLFFGSSLNEGFLFFLQKFESKMGVDKESLAWVFAAFVIAKVLIAIFLCGIVIPLYEHRFLRFSLSKFSQHHNQIGSRLTSRGQQQKNQSIYWLALKDLLQPLFLFSFLLGLLFFWFSVSDHAMFIWLCLRPVAVAYLFFVFCRSSLLHMLPAKLQKFGLFKAFTGFFERTMSILLGDSELDQRLVEE